MEAYEIGHIAPDQIDRAYALLRLAHPAVQPAAWRRYALDVLDRPAGQARHRQIIVAANSLGYIQGLSVAFIAELASGKALDVPVLIVVSAADEHGVRRELLAHLAARAAGLGCSQLRLWIQSSGNWHRHQLPDPAHDAPIDLLIPAARQADD